MDYFKVGLYLVCLIFIIYFTFFLATDYQSFAGRNNLPFIIWVIDTIDLFIHEAGHFIFTIFGRTIYFLGGSLLQIIIPIATVIVFAKNNLRSLMFTLYWTGQSTVNVSIYIGDAPYRKLQLISRGAIHDWNWLMYRLNLMEEIETIAAIVNAIGIITCIAGIFVGLYFISIDGYRLIQQKIEIRKSIR